ncbi:MAG: NAD-dependent epimerase/dehydratase family protein [Anaerolineae bacterium]|nr:NAD-dependent epimerase/dehydratase family protein [Anaerolineae bacterium]
MSSHILITGGAGFIGSHTADALIAAGHSVRVLDSLHPQVHGPSGEFPAYLHPAVERIRGDICDQDALRAALDGVDVVYHMAAETGVGQSQYEVARYFQTNVTGTAALWEAILSTGTHIRRVILSSSRAVYGEGAYHCRAHGTVYPSGRSLDALSQHDWSMKCPQCGQPAESLPTGEDAPLVAGSVYAQTKLFQEEICRLMSATHGLPLVILRYFNVYGPRQALTNPYTGVIATFCTRLLNGKSIAVYEEGVPQRDFVHVRDVVQANLRALASDLDAGHAPVFNVGTGQTLSLATIAETVCEAAGHPGAFERTTRHRIGDILSCTADLSASRTALGYAPSVSFADGMIELVEWLKGQRQPEDRSEQVAAELAAKGLMLGADSPGRPDTRQN